MHIDRGTGIREQHPFHQEFDGELRMDKVSDWSGPVLRHCWL